MIPESAARRVACLAGHVTQGQEHATSLTHQVEGSLWPRNSAKNIVLHRYLMKDCVVQDCAAKHTLQYARACSHVDLKYARPAQPQVRLSSSRRGHSIGLQSSWLARDYDAFSLDAGSSSTN